MKARCVLPAVVLIAMTAGLAACGGSKKAGRTPVISPVATAPLIANIRAARRSSVVFKIFPLHESSIACQIPRGGPYVPGKMRLDGTCTTQIRTYHGSKTNPGGHGSVGIAEVALTERWQYPASNKRWWHTTWIVLVKQGHVLKADTHTTGATPPQSWI
jgi:hypothetical protein